MIRLHKHEAIVEAMSKARCRADGFAWGAISSTLQRDYLKNAAAALDALLEAAVRLGAGVVTTQYNIPYSIILRLEASDDK